MLIRVSSFAAFVLLSATVLHAQSGFNFRIGGGGYDEATAGLVRGANGDLYMAGSTASFGFSPDFLHRNAYVVKVAPDGAVAWTRAIGGASDEAAYGLAPTSDGGCIITGYAQQGLTVDRDLFVSKIAADGTVQWNRTFGGSGQDMGYGVVEDGAGGQLLRGAFRSDLSAAQLDVPGSSPILGSWDHGTTTMTMGAPRILASGSG